MAVRRETVATGARFVGLGFSLAGTVIAALWAGNWLDERWGTSPLFLLIFLVGGLFGFTRRLLWMLQQRPATPRSGEKLATGTKKK